MAQYVARYFPFVGRMISYLSADNHYFRFFVNVLCNKQLDITWENLSGH